MDKNKLNVFTYGYHYWGYIGNWPHNFINFFRTIKWAFQRAIRGYCDLDRYDLNEFYRELFISSISDMEANLWSHPYKVSEEKWRATLKQIVELFKKSDYNRAETENPYYEDYMKMLSERGKKIADFEDFFNSPYAAEEATIRDNYFAQYDLISKDVEKNRKEALKLFSKWFNHLIA